MKKWLSLMIALLMMVSAAYAEEQEQDALSPGCAQQKWDSGETDWVYEWFLENFYTMHVEEQYHFYKLLTAAGYAVDGYTVMETQRMLDERSIGRKELCRIADEAALKASEMTAEDFAAYYQPAFVHHTWDDLCKALVYAITVDQPEGDNHVYQITLNYKTGEVVSIDFTEGVG